MKTAPPHARLVTALFFFSGLSSLVLETVWVRQMVLVFGSTTFAVSTVLTAFMAGLALGSYLAGRFAHRLRQRPGSSLAIYALLELGIGLYALLMPTLAAKLPQLHLLLWGSMNDSYHAFALVRFLLAAVLLALPTLAMGATLPVLAHYVTSGRQESGQDKAVGKAVGTLYAVNTAGAVAGVFCAGFVLLPAMGLWATNLTACLADLVLAGVALLLHGSVKNAAPPEPAPTIGALDPGAGTLSLLARLTLASVAVSGALAMVNQVAWTRALSLIIGSSTYAFSLILLAFLLGLASGAALYARRQAAGPDQLANLAVIHLLTGVTCAFGPLLLMDRLPVIMLALLQRLPMSPPLVFLLKFTLAGVIILLPTFFMGMVFPAVIQIYASASRRGTGSITGTVYAVNTLGAILGSFAGGFLLIPLLGLRETLIMAAGAIVLLGLLFGLASPRPRARILLAVAAVVSLAGITLTARPWNLELLTAGVFRVSRYAGRDASPLGSGTNAKPRTREPTPREETRYLEWLEAARQLIPPESTPDSFVEPPSAYRVVRHAEGVTTTVSMTRAVDFALSSKACWVRSSLLVNGKPDASLSVLHEKPPKGCHVLVRGERPTTPALQLSPQGDTETQVLSGLLPYLLYPGKDPPTSALIIGWGSGVTVGATLATPLTRVTAAELEREVVTTARLFEPYNGTPQDDPRLTLLEADGRNLLASTKEPLDIIISEPSNPWISGCGNLFTREFFQLVKSRLSEDGVFLQWVQAYEISPENVWSILSTIRESFPTVYLFSPSRASADMLILARAKQGPAKVPWGRVAARMNRPQIRKVLAPLGILRPEDLAVRLLAGPAGVKRVSQGAPVNTDDNARVEFAAPKDLINYKQYRARRITRVLEATTPDTLATLLSVSPRGGRAAYCMAALRAGRGHRVPPPAGTESPGMTRCRELARKMIRPLPTLDRPRIAQIISGTPMSRQVHDALSGPTTRASDKVASLISPTGPAALQYAGFVTLGHLSALSGEHFDALAFLLAAWHMQPPPLNSRYPLISRVLAHQYRQCGLYQEALQILDLAD